MPPAPARGVGRNPSGHSVPEGATNRRRLGRLGEEAAVAALRSRGYRILERNVRLRRGEVDVIAEEHGDLVFVEVKARRSEAYGTPAEAVSPRKQRAVAALAAAYCIRRGSASAPAGSTSSRSGSIAEAGPSAWTSSATRFAPEKAYRRPIEAWSRAKVSEEWGQGKGEEESPPRERIIVIQRRHRPATNRLTSEHTIGR